jgi:hypothetical protein
MPIIAGQMFDIEFEVQLESPFQLYNTFMESIQTEAINLFERSKQYLLPNRVRSIC